MMDDGLTHNHKKILRRILRPFAHKIDVVGLFGSRATGKYRENSDIDLVIYGHLTEADVDRLWTECDASALPMKVDVNAYARITYPPLKAHIDAVMRPLFTKQDLLAPESGEGTTQDPMDLEPAGFKDHVQQERSGVLQQGGDGPEGWRTGQLQEIADITMGQSPEGETCNTERRGTPLLNGPTEFGLKSPDPVQFTTDPKKFASKNDILFCVRGSTTGKMNWADQVYAIGRGVAAICHKNGANYQRFLRGVLDCNLESLLSCATGSTFPNISKDQLESLELFVPPLPEQEAIAGVLGSLDDKIDLLHRQNKTLESMAETLFRQWFIEEAQEEWEEGKLGDVIDIFDGQRIPLSKMERDKKKDGVLYPYYGAAQIMDYINDYIFDGEYILLGEDGTVRTEEGYPVLQYATGKFWVNNHTHVIKAKVPYSNFFLWNYLLKKNIDKIVTGAVQPKINQGNLKSLDFPSFPENLVNEYNEISTPLLTKMQKNKNQIRTLEKLRDTLLPKLMSGDVRVVV